MKKWYVICLCSMVTCSINMSAKAPSKPIMLDADTFILDTRQNVFTALNRVQLQQDKMIMTCDQLVGFQSKNILEATGQVRFNNKTASGNADLANYNLTKKLLTLKGNPEVFQAKDHLRGQQIVVDLTSGEIISEGRTKIKVAIDQLKESQ